MSVKAFCALFGNKRRGCAKEVLAVNNGELRVGTPFVEGAVVMAEVINEGRDRKVVIFKKRRRKDSKVKRGFRRDHTRVRITAINA